MNVHELTRDQMIELKQAYLVKLDEEGTLNYVLYGNPGDDTGLAYDELANADSLIPDEIIFNEYAGYEFVPEDFSVANPNTLTIEVSDIIWDIDNDDIIERFGSLTDDNGLPYTSKDFGLPSGVVIQMSKAEYENMVEEDPDIQEAMADYINDRLANEYDFCVTNSTWRFIHINPTTTEEDGPMTVTEYLNSPNGEELKRLFDNYFTDANKRGGKWWRCNCAHFAYISEAWISFCEGHFDTVDEIDDGFADANPNDIFDGIIGWANGSDDAAIVLTCNHNDARDEELRDAWRWYEDYA